eukprot:TRINITY_DN8996_c0_g1_i1.p1 TRINITY_DN8996_c0_g1~~TRINITY_DN8996_c0_g1_i1.p1  ORF type:complete len:255 (-),score=81.14 TRINITY_DN8996_c0_g1_i1:100-864(-)
MSSNNVISTLISYSKNNDNEKSNILLKGELENVEKYCEEVKEHYIDGLRQEYLYTYLQKKDTNKKKIFANENINDIDKENRNISHQITTKREKNQQMKNKIGQDFNEIEAKIKEVTELLKTVETLGNKYKILQEKQIEEEEKNNQKEELKTYKRNVNMLNFYSKCSTMIEKLSNTRLGEMDENKVEVILSVNQLQYSLMIFFVDNEEETDLQIQNVLLEPNAVDINHVVEYAIKINDLSFLISEIKNKIASTTL